MPFYNDNNDNQSNASMPELEEAAPPSYERASQAPARFAERAYARVEDFNEANALLRQYGRCTVLHDVTRLADGRSLCIEFRVVQLTRNDEGAPAVGHGHGLRTFDVTWRWLVATHYADDTVLRYALRADVDNAVIPDDDARLAGHLQGRFTQVAAQGFPLRVTGDRLQRPRVPPGLAARPGTPHPRNAARGAHVDPRLDVPQARATGRAEHRRAPIPVARNIIAWQPRSQNAYESLNNERVIVSANWLDGERLDRFAHAPSTGRHNTMYQRRHISELNAWSVLSCSARSISGIDFKILLNNGEYVWIRDIEADWIEGAEEAIARFWREGHCLSPDIASRMLRWRPARYCSDEWDRVLLDWSTRNVRARHVYRIVNGAVVNVI